MRGKWIPGAVAIAIAAGIVWLLLADGGATTGPPATRPVPRGDDAAADAGAETRATTETQAPAAEPVPPGSRMLTGRVLAAADDAPLPGAEVVAEVRNGPELAGRCDDAGAFSIAVPPRRLRLRATASGFAPAEVSLGTDDRNVVLRLLPEAGVSGLVVRSDTGEPVPDADVYAVTLGYAPEVVARARADADGRFALGGLPAGEFVLLARARSLLTPTGWWTGDGGTFPHAVSVRTGERRETTVEVAPAGAATGHVLLPDGKPAEGAIVRARRSPGTTLPDFFFEGLETKTGPDGRYFLSPLVPEARFRVVAELDGFPSATSEEFEARPDVTGSVDLAFSRPEWIEVVVLDADSGEPFADAPVWGHHGIKEVTVRTGADGRARVGPLPSRAVRLFVAPPAAKDHWSRNLDGGEPTPIVVKLHRGVTIEGTVLLPDGTPAPAASLELRPFPSVPWPTVREKESGADGRFRFEGLDADGRYTISAKLVRDDNRKLAGKSVAAPGEGPVTIRLAAAPPPTWSSDETQTLCFVGPDGAPVTDLVLAVGRLSDHGTTATGGQSVPAELEVHRPGEGWDLLVTVLSARDRQGRRLAGRSVGPIPPAPDPYEIRLDPEERIEGVVFGPGGEGVRGVRVFVRAPPFERNGARSGSGAFDSTLSDAEGRFVLGGLPEGNHQVSVADLRDWLAPDLPPVPTGTTDLEIRLRPAVTATITVLDDRGEPLESAQVFHGSAGKEDTRMEGGVADARGRFVIERLDSTARYRLRVEATGDREEELYPREIEIDDWAPADTTVRFESGWRLTGTVLDAQGRPVPGASVTVLDADGETLGQGGVYGEGRFDVSNLPRRELTARVSLRGEPVKETTVRPGDGPVAIEIDPGPGLLVVVDDWPGEWGPTRGAPARLVRMDGGRFHRREYARGGRVRFLDLDPEAEYGLWIPLGDRAVHETGLRVSGEEIHVRTKPAGRVTVNLTDPGTAKPGVSLEGPGIDFDGEYGSRGAYTFEGVPAGVFTIRARVYVEGEWRERTTRVSPGDDVEIDTR